MGKLVTALVLILWCSIAVRAQTTASITRPTALRKQTTISSPPVVIGFPGVPTGTCGALQLAVNQSNGDLYSCNNGVWTKSTGSSPGGSTTQIQFNNSGSLAGSSSLAWDNTALALEYGLLFSNGKLASDMGFSNSANTQYSLLGGTYKADSVNVSNHFYAGGVIGCEYAGSATLTNSSCTGLYTQSLQNGTGSISQLTGINAFAFNQAGTVSDKVTGLETIPENDGTAGTVVGVDVGAYNLGTVTNLFGFSVLAIVNSGGTVTGETAGLKVYDVHGAGPVSYGIHVADQGTAATDYAIKVDGGKSEFNGSVNVKSLLTNTNCSSAASPAVCASAPAGAVAIPTGVNPTLTINTTAVTASSRIFLQVDESLASGGATCNTTLSALVQPVVTARVAGTSFTIQMNTTLAANPACVSYLIAN